MGNTFGSGLVYGCGFTIAAVLTIAVFKIIGLGICG